MVVFLAFVAMFVREISPHKTPFLLLKEVCELGSVSSIRPTDVFPTDVLFYFTQHSASQ